MDDMAAGAGHSADPLVGGSGGRFAVAAVGVVDDSENEERCRPPSLNLEGPGPYRSGDLDRLGDSSERWRACVWYGCIDAVAAAAAPG